MAFPRPKPTTVSPGSDGKEMSTSLTPTDGDARGGEHDEERPALKGTDNMLMAGTPRPALQHPQDGRRPPRLRGGAPAKGEVYG